MGEALAGRAGLRICMQEPTFLAFLQQLLCKLAISRRPELRFRYRAFPGPEEVFMVETAEALTSRMRGD